ncbi:CLN3 protein-domain-containing protein [Fomitopsis serialis]|uniref:CLN3 protein-domain-containing protein n=1 Tax=Fomitopsis serialis TaxID=139415 RepID=UPI0020073FAE|nr:CLN3 protein-domain-containing protein [Neoantrodia serialis]KAH9931511.1 CLN3 protein-domain-containing protein [Neoantrodia serialis]
MRARRSSDEEIHELETLVHHDMQGDHVSRYTEEEEGLLSPADESVGLKGAPRNLLRHLGLSFFFFGLINNVLYVIILSAALDLVPPSTPKGIIAFCNIFPSLLVKLGWPYLLRGRVRYAMRLVGCAAVSVLGMWVIAAFDSLFMRLLGICCASFSSGLGELTFLQLSTRYHPPSVAGHSVGYFASGTGAAGLVGAFLWWELRGLGVRIGVGLSSVLPLVIPLTYFLLLPQPATFANADLPPTALPYSVVAAEYTALPTGEEDTPEGETEGVREAGAVKTGGVALSMEDKWRLVKPLVGRYMMPLFCVYLFEYTINQGIAPTLLYPVPAAAEHPLMSKIIHSIRDFYPLWQLVYQTSVFLSRSTLSLGLPPLPASLLPLPAIIQAFVLLTLALESAVGLFDGGGDGGALAFGLVFGLISIEGICGGLAYVNVYHRVNQEADPDTRGIALDADTEERRERARQEREFKIGSIGIADGAGILLASIVSVPTEVALCRAQVGRGRTLCEGL